MQSLRQLRSEPHISVSALKMHIACPRSHALRLDGVEPAFRAVALALGSSLHRAVGAWLLELRAGRQPRRADALEVLRDSLASELCGDGPPVLLEDEETENELHEQAAAMLSVVLDALPTPDRVLGVEVPFRIELADPDTGRRLEVPLIGAIDAVTEEAGAVVFLELKSGKRRWPQDQVDTDLQLTAYRQALRARGCGDPRPRLLVVTKGKVPAVQLEAPQRGEQHERDLAAMVSGVLKSVKAGVDYPNRSHFGCKVCPYARACR